MPFTPKLNSEQRDEIVERYKLGIESVVFLAKEFDVHPNTIRKLLKSQKVKAPETTLPRVTGASLIEFKKRARSVLWRHDGREKKAYNLWEKRTADLEKEDGLTSDQAVIKASREFPCLERLFRDYDLSQYDLESEEKSTDHPEGRKRKNIVENEEIKQTHRENLNWAISAAGEFIRTGTPPTTCPNNAAYYLYRQACEEPKDFLSRFNQIEGKDTDDGGAKEKQSSQRSIKEITSMLETLKGEENEL